MADREIEALEWLETQIRVWLGEGHLRGSTRQDGQLTGAPPPVPASDADPEQQGQWRLHLTGVSRRWLPSTTATVQLVSMYRCPDKVGVSKIFPEGQVAPKASVTPIHISA